MVTKQVTTFRQLRDAIKDFDDYQLDCNLTVEIAIEDECYPAELRFAGEEHGVLDENHPVFYVID
ncbi:MAG: hypothetical protein ACQESR_07650 [Planctomycetota bacterium]